MCIEILLTYCKPSGQKSSSLMHQFLYAKLVLSNANLNTYVVRFLVPLYHLKVIHVNALIGPSSLRALSWNYWSERLVCAVTELLVREAYVRSHGTIGPSGLRALSRN